MKKNIAIISFLLLSLSIAGQNLQTEGSQYVSGKLSVYPAGTTPDNGYNGNITITKPASTGQYINLIRQGNYPWSIGMVYNTNNFAIGNAVPNDQNFNNPFFVIGTNGNVGIGTPNPNAVFQVGNSFSDLGSPKMRIVAPVEGTGSVVDGIHIDSNDGGNFDKGVAISMGLMNSTYGEYTSRIVHYGNTAQTRASKLQLQTHSSTHGVWNTGIIIDNEGKVGIGLTNPDAMLTVNGIIHAKEIKVDLTGSLADYVFSPDYSLMPLPEVEKFVKINRHLPEIPSAAEVKENGLSMGEMQNKLLQKIEELTLYVIEQQKQIDSLKKDLQLK